MSTPPSACVGGRPAGQARQALLAALQAGVVGTFDALARHAGVPEHQARYTLANLRRAGLAHCAAPAHHPHSAAPQRVRSIYTPQSHPASAPLDALRFAAQVWR